MSVPGQPADHATDGEQGNSADNQPARNPAARIENLEAIESVFRSVGSADLDNIHAPVIFGRGHKKSMNSRSGPGNRRIDVRP